MDPWATPDELEPMPVVADRTTFSIVWRKVDGSSKTCRSNRVANEVNPQKADTWPAKKINMRDNTT